MNQNMSGQNELSVTIFCSQSQSENLKLKMKSDMKTKKQKETSEKETSEKDIHLLEQKGYEKMTNEIVPIQQAETYQKPTKKVVKEAVKELNPDINSLGSRG